MKDPRERINTVTGITRICHDQINKWVH